MDGDSLTRPQNAAAGINLVMTSNPSQSGFEDVFTVTDYYDGPRQGIANYLGSPHFFDCIFSDEKQDYSNLYRLTHVTDQTFQLALEDWAIWTRWDHAFKAGQTSEKTHPALPEDAVRHAEIQSLVADHLKTDPVSSIVRTAKFLILQPAEIRAGILIDLLVRWSEPEEASNDRIWADPQDNGQSVQF